MVLSRSGARRAFLFLTVSLSCGVLAAPLARADEGRKVAGVVFPETLPVGGTVLKLNGVGVRVFFHLVNGYATGLYVVTPAHDAEAVMNEPNPKVIYTQFLHDASEHRIREEYDAIHARYCKVNACGEKNEAAYATFMAHQTAAEGGTSQTILITDQGVSVQRGGKEIVHIDNPDFGKALVASLVGPAAPTESYRNGILGVED
ncbi:chalcone isomerase family protein [Acidomonas methanolica]|uniref:Chalcone isomerase domain-containing protein n=1 Tax=Acidomonas methanolica NBRC 104435 TaxID=1231351 RepID=A0A023D268_ACIMT|nr:chalcone isomerase family protein [Acidomonas methanolica]MBU2654119.1 chalcone isomerase family protein [Acidomonas methanolica]TCS30653.1 chalcone isomerase-like protein [Acidomonas methanolica]GAJ28217.1 hypothetical protein Amme_015_084 [Acidomonas methanolica NBRC 104435]GBQ47221.1 hypothetical protein AA0498_0476 [Acidomonas methanolica]GEK98959.1 hypothetical protein AME01nite_14580 [Acidomonas methanolica NBRC 104435]